VLVGGIAAFATVDEMVSLTNIGTLFAFILVCIGVVVLRHKDPDRPRPFRVPFGPYLLPILGAVSCAALIYFLPEGSYWRFLGWLAIGLSIYLAYGYSRSSVGQKAGRSPHTPLLLKVAAVGFLLVAVGLFYIPHDATFAQLVDKLTGADPEQHGRTLTGFLILLVGLVIGVGGAALGTTRVAGESAER
jgi:basic amino acid/polyamine antiporter, APA family